MIREKATPQEISDRFQVYTTLDSYGNAHIHDEKPSRGQVDWQGPGATRSLDNFFDVAFSGDWKDSLHSPRCQYVKGERVIVWNDCDVFAHVRKVAIIKEGRIWTLYPHYEPVTWDNYCPYDESLLGVPIAEWPEE